MKFNTGPHTYVHGLHSHCTNIALRLREIFCEVLAVGVRVIRTCAGRQQHLVRLLE
jgi:hypothetical protein